MALLLAAVLTLCGTPRPLAGQNPPDLDDSFWGDSESTYFLANTLISGVGAGVVQALRGGSFKNGFLQGALGGAVGYSARRIASRKFDGAGFLGRQIGALGASITHNAGRGEGAFSHLIFPIGPLNLHLDREDGPPRWYAKVDGPALVMATVLAFHPDAEVDWEGTASTGAFVFRSTRGWFLGQEEGVVGQTLLGTIILRERDGRDILLDSGDILPGRGGSGNLDRTLRHETVHLLQSDFAFHAAGSPLEGWLLGHHPLTRRIHEGVDFNLLVPMGMTFLSRGLRLSYVDRPYEAEALFLAGL